jgi:hypothetical protein
MKVIYILILSIGLAACGGSSKPCKSKKCKDFKTQQEAQETFESDKDCYKNLDKDNDGIACEDLPDKK